MVQCMEYEDRVSEDPTMGHSSEIEGGKKISKAYPKTSSGINEQIGDGPEREPQKAWKHNDMSESVSNRTHMRVRERFMHVVRWRAGVDKKGIQIFAFRWTNEARQLRPGGSGVKTCLVGAVQGACGGAMGGEMR